MIVFAYADDIRVDTLGERYNIPCATIYSLPELAYDHSKRPYDVTYSLGYIR